MEGFQKNLCGNFANWKLIFNQKISTIVGVLMYSVLTPLHIFNQYQYMDISYFKSALISESFST